MLLASLWIGLVGDVSAQGEPTEPVGSFPVGPLELLVARNPLRFSWLLEDDPLVAERYRRRVSALEYRDAGGWRGLGEVRDAAPLETRRREGTIPAKGWRFRVASQESGESVVDCLWDESLAACVLQVRREGARTEGWRFDLVRRRGEELAGVAPRVFARRAAGESVPPARSGSRARETPPASAHPSRGRADSSGADHDTESARRPSVSRLVFSSRGYGLLIRGGREAADVFAPDPDAYRVETSESRLELYLVPGAPRRVLEAYAAICSNHGDEPAADSFPWGAVERWELPSLPAGVASSRAELTPLWVAFPTEKEAWRERRVLVAGERLLLIGAGDAKAPSATVFLPPGRWRTSWQSGRVLDGAATVTLALPSTGGAWLERNEAESER